MSAEQGDGKTGSEAVQAPLRRREKSKESQADKDLQWLLSEERGRRFLWGLFDAARCNVFGSSFAATQTDGAYDPGSTAFNEGRRSIGIDYLLDAQRVAPTEYARMVAEAIERVRVDQVQKHHAESQAGETNTQD